MRMLEVVRPTFGVKMYEEKPDSHTRTNTKFSLLKSGLSYVEQPRLSARMDLTTYSKLGGLRNQNDMMTRSRALDINTVGREELLASASVNSHLQHQPQTCSTNQVTTSVFRNKRQSHDLIHVKNRSVVEALVTTKPRQPIRATLN